MRIAVFADIHGNATALEAVLNDVRRARPGEVVFLGDALLRVPMPAETMELLRAENPMAVGGNYDRIVCRSLPNLEERFAQEPYLDAEIAWTCDRITPEDQAYLRALPSCIRLFAGTWQEVCFVHGSPFSFRGLFPQMSDDECMALLRDEPASTIVCGHTHAAMDRTVGRYRIVNPGSVMLGRGPSGSMDGRAWWILLSWDGSRWRVKFRSTEYDHRRVWEAFATWHLLPLMQQHEERRHHIEQARRWAEHRAGLAR